MSLHEAYTQLAGKPWCMRPWEIARLTDYQIDHLYRLPAAKAARELDERMKTRTATPAQDYDETPVMEPPPERGALVALIEKWGGRTRAQAEKEADERLANWTPDRG